MVTGLPAILLSIGVIAAIVLGAGGMWLLARRQDTKRGLLMLGAAVVTLGNVLIWTV